MQKRSTLISLLAIYSMLTIAGWLNRDTIFHWAFLERVSQYLLLTTWICLLTSLPILIALIVMSSSLRWARTDLYTILLYVCNIVIIFSFCSEGTLVILRQKFPGLLPPYTTTQIRITYKPPVIPVSISVDSDGKISIEGNTALVTPIGTVGVSIGFSTASYLQPDGKTLLLVISHLKNSFIARDGYKVATGRSEVYVETDGRTIIFPKSNELDIDATQGEVKDVEIHGATLTASG